MSDDLIRQSTNFYNDAIYGFEVAREFAAGYVAPLLTANKSIELHRLALEETFKTEALEAIEKFNKVSLVKNPQYIDENERQQVRSGIKELLDVQAVLNSFLMLLEQEYEISVKECMNMRIPNWKAKGWIE